MIIYTNTYDAKGRVIATTVGGEDGSVSHRFTTKYDDNHRVVKSSSSSYDQKSGQLLSKHVNTYDERGLVHTILTYDPRGRLVRRETYTREFDQRGNWITQRLDARENDQSGTFTYIKRRKITYY